MPCGEFSNGKIMHILLLDNYDSFTYNLYDYFLRLGTQCTVIANDACKVADLADKDWAAVVLSPGPARPKDAGILMEAIDYFHTRKPILGVCLGHQAIGEYFGATLRHAAIPMHGKISPIQHCQNDIFSQLPQPMPVMRYHSLILEELPPTIIAQAHSPTGEIMAIRHEKLPIWGVQFHPESIGSPQGLFLLQNWLNLVKNPHP
jgi:anthranilate synthase/aminodeoxychorismate synthase-like glutamine amidotransferase